MADTFIWYELMTSDLEAALDFYRDVVGWRTEDHANSDLSGFRYAILSAGERGVGGAMQLTDAMREGGARPGWIGYIGVPDTDAKAREIAADGGRIMMEPGDIPGVGRFALVADPGGAPFYLLTPTPGQEDQGSADRESPGHVAWHELYTAQGEEAAFAFYARHFGWETVGTMDMGPMGQYRLVGTEGGAFGAMMNKPEQIPVSLWGFYFAVDGIDAAVQRIEAARGQVTMDPHEVPDGSWIVQARDPQGAAFALNSKTR